MAGAALLLAAGIGLSYRYSPNRPVRYERIEDHFKYGSIGGDTENGLPLRVLQVLPRMFPEYLPAGAPRDYTAFGFLEEPGHPMPIGFSVRRRIIDLAGLNCAACHVGSVRAAPDAAPIRYPAMPANTVDLQSYFDFLFRATGDARFTPDRVLAEMERDGAIFALDRLIYRRAIATMKATLAVRERAMRGFLLPDHPRFGPGRVDTFNPYKTGQFAAYYPDGVPAEERIGTVDLPSIWDQRMRRGMDLHWDGDNTSVAERNVSAAFGAGATRESVDLAQIGRIEAWLDDLQPPRFPFGRVDAAARRRGEAVFAARCASCHAPGGVLTGRVVPIEDVGTDRHRLDSYTEKLRRLQLLYSDDYDWGLRHFQKTYGYAAAPLDGVWARAPYLHNGSVPTMWDLLTPAERRPQTFYRGHDVYDPVRLGFRADVREVGGRRAFLFDTREPGNGNQGHTGPRYGTDLGDGDKQALIEFLKTL